MEIGYKIKKVRELRNFTQEYMSERLGISQVSYSRVENGKTKIDLKRLNKIAQLLDIDTIFLINFDEKSIFENCSQCNKTAYVNRFLSEKERLVFEETIFFLKNENKKLRELQNL